MGRATMTTLAIVVFAVVVGYLSVFTVSETQLAILFRLGKIEHADYKPGLHFMWPLVNNVRKFDKRIMTVDGEPQEILTSGKRTLLVDYYVKWRIKNVEAYYLAYSGLAKSARDRLAAVIKNALQDQFNQRTIRQVVTEDRSQIMANVTKRANQVMGKFGAEVVDVRIKQVELPTGVREAVFRRMRTERDRIAKELRAKGRKEATIIEAQAKRQRIEILAAAQRQAAQIMGAGDAAATAIYAKAYGQAPEFYRFYRSLNAYRDSFDNKRDILVLSPDSEFFKYFNSINPKH